MRDIIGTSGMVILAAGLFGRFGWELTAIICGSTLLALAVIGAMRR